MDGKKSFEKGLLLRLAVLFAMILAISLLNANFISAYNLAALLTDIGLLLITSLGMTFVLLIGSIDLSLGSTLSCGAIMMAALLPQIGLWAYLATILFGVLLGLANGLIFVKLRIPSFISTLGTMNMLSCLALLLCNSTPIIISPKLKWLVSWVNIKIGLIPITFVVAVALMLLLWMVQTRTKFGKYCVSIGANESAARMAGINIDKVKIAVFALAGFCYAIAAIVLTSSLRSGIPNVGNSYSMMSIAAAALGGTSLSGGRGSVLYSLIGAALSVIITNGMILIGVNAYWMQIIYGVIIIVAIITTVNRKDSALVIK